MKKIVAASLLALAALPAAAVAQDGPRLWADLAESRSIPDPGQEGRRGGQVVEEWYSPQLRGSLAVYGRVSFPSSTDVTVDGLWYSDFFNPGWGFSVEGDLLSYVAPHWGVGPYLSAGWDRFDGQTIHFPLGDVVEADHMDLTTLLIGGKVYQRFSPMFAWDGHMGVGWVHYSSVKWSGVDFGVPFSNEELFRSTDTAVGEIGGRFIFGGPNFEVALCFGIRIMGGPNRGKDVNSNVDPDILTTFMIELGLTARF